MSQIDLYKIFENNPNKWFTRYDFDKVLTKNSVSIMIALSKLRRFGFIYKKTVLVSPPYHDWEHKYNVRKFKLVPKGKFVTYKLKNDKLNSTGNTKFV